MKVIITYLSLAHIHIHARKVLPLVQVELDSGDALFFHCNVLHQSDQNNSDRRRWAFLIAYNRASNPPVIKHHHPQYTPLVKVGMCGSRIHLLSLGTELSRHLATVGEKVNLAIRKTLISGYIQYPTLHLKGIFP